MNLKFIDREEELSFLNKRYAGNDFEFFVIYGRRRIGKTELIKEFIKDKSYIYLICDKGGTKRNAYRLNKKISELFDEPVIASEDIEEIFEHLAKKTQKNRLVVLLDEFSYLVEKDSSIPSIFQAIVDESLKQTGIFLILCGSSISMMEKGVLSYKSPLYGRKTAHIRLNPIPFRYFSDFFPKNDFVDNLEVYAVLGGIPFYLEKFSAKKSIIENIKEQIFSKDGKLYEEIDFMLQEELREPDVYKSILAAIGGGSTKLAEIAGKSGIPVQDMDKYLKVLIRLGLVEREVPVTETKSKKSIYKICDPFFNFFFTFCANYKSDLEIRDMSRPIEKLKTDFQIFMGNCFEKFIREEFLISAKIMHCERIGRWWGHYRNENNERKETEIDVIAIDESKKEILFGECKWKENVDAKKMLNILKERAGMVHWNDGKRKEHFALFAKSFEEKITGAGVHCFDLSDMKRI